MKPKGRAIKAAKGERTVVPFPNWWQRRTTSLSAFHLREQWWRFLDRWETNRGLRWVFYSLLAAVVAVAAICFWAYPWWTRRNSIRIAREWLLTGHLKYSAEAVQQAMVLAPENPEPWQIASELARLGGQKAEAVEYARHAAGLAPDLPDYTLDWAAAALRADLPQEASQALDKLSAAQLAQSPHALRLLGELDRRNLHLSAAKAHFEAALQLDGPKAIDEVPLGTILLNSTDARERERGLGLLVKWSTDHEWGATSLRTLLNDAVGRDEHPAMVRWADALRAHPGCTNGDMANCLLALSKADEVHFADVLADMEKKHAATPASATQLLSWLNQIGRSADALRWMETLPQPNVKRPPLAVAKAESLRLLANWTALAVWTQDTEWSPDVNFLRWAYGLQAARMLGEETRAAELWRTLDSHAQLNGAHALFAGSTIYAWGLEQEAEALWWRAAEQEGKISIDALGTLARHYQVHQDAAGQYRVFRRLHLLRPTDAAIGNNFAFFAVLNGREERAAEQVARANLAAEPANRSYLATCAFTVLQQNRAAEALALIKPAAAEASKSPAIAFVYGLALAANGQQAQARPLLTGIPPATLTLREQEMIKAALGN
jgi:predicted Zn-dependent protease